MSAFHYPVNRTKEAFSWARDPRRCHVRFLGDSNRLRPGPLGYRLLVYFKAINAIPNFMFPLNRRLADGFSVSFVFDSFTRVLNIGRSSNSIIAASFLTRSTGTLSSPLLFTLLFFSDLLGLWAPRVTLRTYS